MLWTAVAKAFIFSFNYVLVANGTSFAVNYVPTTATVHTLIEKKKNCWIRTKSAYNIYLRRSPRFLLVSVGLINSARIPHVS